MRPVRKSRPPSFTVGEEVRISDGPFARFHGVIEEIDDARACLKVAAWIYGRSTPIEVEFRQVEKL